MSKEDIKNDASVEATDEGLKEATNTVKDDELDGEKAATTVKASIDKSKPAKTDLKIDKKSQEKMPKSKMAMVNAGYKAMSKMTEEQLETFLADILEEDLDDYQVVDFKEDVDALIQSDATLSEDFKAKAEVIFESALKAKLVEHVDRLEEEYSTMLAEQVETIQEELVTKVDSYLDYVVENWLEQNELAVETGIRADIAESFMASLKDIFTEHYVDIPESKIDLVDGLVSENADLEEKLNSAIARGIELQEQAEETSKELIIREHSNGLSAIQTEKLRGLVEDVDFDDSFEDKLSTLKESYFGNKSGTITEDKKSDDEFYNLNENNADPKVVSAAMQSYLTALKNNK